MTELSTIQESKFAPQNFTELMQFSEFASKTDLVPPAFKGKPQDIMLAVQMGAEVGLQPMQALQNVAVINGRPSLWGDAVMAICRAHGSCEFITESFDETTMTATCIAKRHGNQEHVTTFSQRDAEFAGLWGKRGPWVQYPKRMLQMRARGFCLRDTFPDALRGFAMAEEAQDTPPQKIKPMPGDIEAEFELDPFEHMKGLMSDKGVSLERINKKLSSKLDAPVEYVEQIPLEFAPMVNGWLDSLA